jgi:molybdenum cofactor cytidylyltransferase
MIAGLILAAGESSRMGTDKALLIYRGRTFLESVMAMLREAGIERIAVVLGHHAEEIQRAVNPEGAEVVINRDYQCGQTSSLQAGLKALESPELEAIVLSLVDHPAVPAGVVQQLIARFQQSGAPVVIPTFEGQRGHPVLIGRGLFKELLELTPEEGANSIIRRYGGATQFIGVEEPGVIIDVNDPETYHQLQGKGI